MIVGDEAIEGYDSFGGLRHAEVKSILDHPLYDVRAAALKSLLAQSTGQHDSHNLEALLCCYLRASLCLVAGSHHDCVNW